MQFILSNARQPELLLKTSGADVKPSKKKLKKNKGVGVGGIYPPPLNIRGLNLKCLHVKLFT